MSYGDRVTRDTIFHCLDTLEKENNELRSKVAGQQGEIDYLKKQIDRITVLEIKLKVPHKIYW